MNDTSLMSPSCEIEGCIAERLIFLKDARRHPSHGTRARGRACTDPRSTSLARNRSGHVCTHTCPGSPLSRRYFIAHFVALQNRRSSKLLTEWSEWQDLNLRPPRPERGALLVAL